MVLQCNIQAGGQPNRPEWLQTGFAYPRVLPALLHMAPEVLVKVTTAPRPIALFTNKVTAPSHPLAVAPVPSTAQLTHKNSVVLRDEKLPPVLAQPEVRPPEKHLIGSQRSSGVGAQPPKPTPDLCVSVASFWSSAKCCVFRTDRVDLAHMPLTSFPAVRQLVIGGPKTGGPPVIHLNFNLPWSTRACLSLLPPPRVTLSLPVELYSLATHELEIKNIAPHPVPTYRSARSAEPFSVLAHIHDRVSHLAVAAGGGAAAVGDHQPWAVAERAGQSTCTAPAPHGLRGSHHRTRYTFYAQMP